MFFIRCTTKIASSLCTAITRTAQSEQINFDIFHYVKKESVYIYIYLHCFATFSNEIHSEANRFVIL